MVWAIHYHLKLNVEERMCWITAFSLSSVMSSVPTLRVGIEVIFNKAFSYIPPFFMCKFGGILNIWNILIFSITLWLSNLFSIYIPNFSEYPRDTSTITFFCPSKTLSLGLLMVITLFAKYYLATLRKVVAHFIY